MDHIADEVLAKDDPAFLENEDVGGAARPVKTFRTALLQEHPLGYFLRIIVLMVAVTLDNVPDQQGHHLNHRPQAGLAPSFDVGIDDGYHPLVFRKGGGQGNNSPRVAGMIGPLYLIEVEDFSGYGGMIIMVFFRGQPENGKVSVFEEVNPGPIS